MALTNVCPHCKVEIVGNKTAVCSCGRQTVRCDLPSWRLHKKISTTEEILKKARLAVYNE